MTETEKDNTLTRLYLSLIHRENELTAAGVREEQLGDDKLVQELLKKIWEEEGKRSEKSRFALSKNATIFIILTFLLIFAGAAMVTILRATVG